MRHPFATLLLACAATAACTALVVTAGPLDPPAGAPSSTYKTLSEVEPRIPISAATTPGDADSLYKITQPGSYYLTGNITGVSGKSGIEISSGGVTLDLNGFHLVGVAGSLDGIGTSVSSLANIRVVNGSVRGWGDAGIDLLGFTAPNFHVENVAASHNLSDGIRASNGGTITNCSAYANGGIGVRANQGCIISDCTSYENLGGGIQTGQGSTVSGCNVFNTGGHGIDVGIASVVVRCSSRISELDGIRCGAQSVIANNSCSFSGNGGNGAGIHVMGSDCRIEGNTCSSADRGIDVDNAGNFISRNICSGNTVNWDIVSGNVCLVVQASTAAAINGNAGGVAPGSTDPNANFTY